MKPDVNQTRGGIQNKRGFQTLVLIFCVWAAWTCYGLLEAVLQYHHQNVPWRHAVKEELLIYYIQGGLIIPFWYLAKVLVGQRSWPIKLGFHLIGAPIYALIWFVLYYALYPVVMAPDILTLSSLQHYVFYILENAVRAYMVATAVGYIWQYQKQLREKERVAAELALHANQMELAGLKARLNPHFLFNALHSVNALVGSEPETARRVLAALGDSLRYALDSDKSQTVSLESELAFVDTYLQIEQIRFGDRLQIHRRIDRALRQTPVPPMILQPLVENVVIHAVARVERPVNMTIAARREDAFLELCVTDDGPGRVHGQEQSHPAGHALNLTRMRLQKMYGEGAELREPPRENGFAVSLRLPLDRGEGRERMHGAVA